MDFLIHIGLPKAGSTWLQGNLFFREERGFAAMPGGIPVNHFLYPCPFRFDGKKTREFYAPRMEDAWARSLYPVLTHEDLCGLTIIHKRNTAKIVGERLHETFPGAKVLICVREQKAIARSLFAQQIRDGGRKDIDTYLGTGNERPGFLPTIQRDQLEYDLLVSHYQGLFGRECVLVQPLERLERDPESFQRELFRFLGVTLEPVRTQEHRNKAFGSATLRLCRSLNRFSERDPLGRGGSTALWLNDRLCRVFDRLCPPAIQRRLRRRDEAYIAELYGDYFRPSNARLAERTGLPLASYGYDV